MANVWLIKKLQVPEFILLVVILYRSLQWEPLFFETNNPCPPEITGGKQRVVRVSKDPSKLFCLSIQGKISLRSQ